MRTELKDHHEPLAVMSPFGWLASCSCGTFKVGFFPSAAAAKRAALNNSHAENRKEIVK